MICSGLMAQSSRDRKDAVWQIVLAPMQQTFPAPTHLRGNKETKDQALRLYEKALIGFEDDVLQSAWEQVGGKNELWCWPPSGELVKACREAKIAKARQAPKDNGLESKANELANGYIRSFMKRSRVAAKARLEGWALELKAYLSDVAWVQAQFLVGMKYIGWSGSIVKGFPPESRKSQDQQVAEFLADAKAQAARGSIRVNVPHTLIRRWEEECRERKPEEKGRVF